MAESSSAIRIVPSGMSDSFVVGGLRQQNPEDGASRGGFAFDDAAMLANALRDKREAETRPTAFGGDERVEYVRHEVGRNTRAIVLHGHFERQADAFARDCGTETHARPIAGRQRDLSTRFGQRISSVSYEIHE